MDNSNVSKDNLIKISYYENPHKFYFKFERNLFDKSVCKAVIKNESKLLEVLDEFEEEVSGDTLRVGDIVAFFHETWQRFVRAEILGFQEIDGSPTCKLLLLDYGNTHDVQDFHTLRRLPKESLSGFTQIINIGSLNLDPVSKIFNSKSLQMEKRKMEKWSQTALDIFQNFIKESKEISFISKSNEQQLFTGSLYVKTKNGNVVNLNQFLIEAGEAVEAETICGPIKINDKSSNEKLKDSDQIQEEYQEIVRSFKLINEIEKTFVGNDEDNIPKPELMMPAGSYYRDRIHKVNESGTGRKYQRRNKYIEMNSRDVPFKSDETAEEPENPQSTLNTDYLKKALNLRKKPSTKVIPEQPEPHVEKPVKCNHLNAVKMLYQKGLKVEEPKVKSLPKVTKIENYNNELQEVHESNDSDESDVTKKSSKKVNELLHNLNLRMLDKLQQKVDKFCLSDANNINLYPKPPDWAEGIPISVPQSAQDFNSIKSTSVSNTQRILQNPSLLQKREIHRVLVLESTENPIEKIEEANFTDTVLKKMLKMGVSDVYRIQSYAWPVIMSGSSIGIVSARQTGKTWSYIPALCSLALDLIALKTDENSVGPTFVIFCKSSKDVEKICDFISRLTSGTKMKIVKALAHQNQNEVFVELLNGCDFFVSTPACFVRLAYNEQFTVFSRQRIQTMVFDDLDQMIRNSLGDVRNCLRICCSFENSENNPQIIVTTNIWTSVLRSIFTLTVAPALCIGNYIEAAVLANCVMELIWMQPDTKMVQLKRYLKNESYQYQRTMIVARDPAEVQEIEELLNLMSIASISIYDESSVAELRIAHNWEKEKQELYKVVICSDRGLATCNLKKIQRLIHYSLPDQWSTFSFRFSVCFDFYKETIKDFLETYDLTEQEKPSSLVLLDENNNEQLPRLIDFLDCHNSCQIQQPIRDKVQRILMKREEKLGMETQFCKNILETGKCSENFFCTDRHTLTRFDEPSKDFPKFGKIKFRIMTVHSPKHYSVKIEKILLEKSEGWKSFRPELPSVEFFLSFRNYFNDVENQIIQYPIKVDDLCAVEWSGQVHRCKVLKEFPPKNKHLHDYSYYDVRLIDAGPIVRIPGNDLWKLPDEFKEFPAATVEVFITNLVPLDYDESWSKNLVSIVMSWISEYEKNPNVSFAASIELVFSDKIFVNSIYILEKFETLNVVIVKESLKTRLLKEKLCNEDLKLVERLIELCKMAGLLEQVPNLQDDFADLMKLPNPVIELPPIVKEKPKPKWIQLSEGIYYPVEVWNFSSPDNFLVRIEDAKNVKNLKKKISKHFENENPILRNPQKGDLCLIKDPEIEDIERGRVLEVNDSDFKCIWVDTGLVENYKPENLFEMPEDIMTMMPFQLVRCKLAGISPKNTKTWSDESVDEIYSKLILHSNNLFIKVMEEQSTKLPGDELIGCQNYEVLLIDCSTAEDILINKRIVDENLADPDPKNQHYLNAYVCVRDERSVPKQGPTKLLNLADESDFDVNIPKQELVELYSIPENSEILKPLEPEEILKLSENPPEKSIQPIKEKKKEVESTEVILSNEIKDMPNLFKKHPTPKITWQQSELFIKLAIDAPDCVDYTFELSAKNLILIVKLVDGYQTVLLNLFGCVEPQLTSHEICGNRIYIRIIKSLMGKIPWPRLLKNQDKNLWLTYDMESKYLDQDVEESTLMRQLDELRNKYVKNCHHPPNDSDEEYVEIPSIFQGDMDVYDPLADEFM